MELENTITILRALREKLANQDDHILGRKKGSSRRQQELLQRASNKVTLAGGLIGEALENLEEIGIRPQG